MFPSEKAACHGQLTNVINMTPSRAKTIVLIDFFFFSIFRLSVIS